MPGMQRGIGSGGGHLFLTQPEVGYSIPSSLFVLIDAILTGQDANEVVIAEAQEGDTQGRRHCGPAAGWGERLGHAGCGPCTMCQEQCRWSRQAFRRSPVHTKDIQRAAAGAAERIHSSCSYISSRS